VTFQYALTSVHINCDWYQWPSNMRWPRYISIVTGTSDLPICADLGTYQFWILATDSPATDCTTAVCDWYQWPSKMRWPRYISILNIGN